MDVSEAIRKRRSVRSYLDKPVAPGILKRVLEAGRLAPSASNRQEWRYVVVTDKSTREKLSQAANQSFLATAPVLIVCCAETDGHIMSCGEKCYPIDCAISIDHMTLQAAELGLGTCWIGAFSPDKVKKILGIPKEIIVVEMLALGYPASMPPSSPRKSLDEIVRYEKW
ncbi:MAG: nitroreductase family protein [Elusimicrobia bacterium]|nr:nitroreductase family protein [Elusimicrobiota bacterium]